MPDWACLTLLAVIAASQADAPLESASSDEIIVTGERVPRTLRETSSSVSVVTSADLEAQSEPDRIEELLELIPNVQLGNGSQGPAIRGQDATGALSALPAFLGGNRPRTTLIVDGRPSTYNEFVFGVGPIWDVERVEVFRSPQTTTQGQNSIAGAIFVHTHDPEFRPEFRLRGIFGEANRRQLSAVVSGPVVPEQVAMRISGDYYYGHPSSEIADRAVGADPNHDEYGIVRAKLVATPSILPAARLELTYSHLQSQAPQLEGVRAPFRERRDPGGFYGTFRIDVDALTGRLMYDLTDDLTARILATRGISKAQRFAPAGLGQTRIDAKDWFVEGVFDWSPDGPVKLVGGVSHSEVKLDQFIDLSALVGIGEFKDKQGANGLFGEVSWELLARTTLTAGLRYQHDSQDRNGALGTGSSAIDLAFDRSFNAWLPKVSLAYDFTNDLRAGVLVQKAYNPGGTTLRFDIGEPDNFEAETLWDYELFMRGSFAGGAVTMTANLFYYDMRDSQRAKGIIILTPDGFEVGFADLFNISHARSYGLEATMEWRASSRFSTGLAVGLLDTKIVRSEEEYAEITGKEFDRSPHFSTSAWAEWRPIDRLFLSLQASHNSGYFSDDLNDPDIRVEGWIKVDARAEWQAGRFKIFGYARNALDKLYMTSLGTPAFGTAGDPRELGIGVEARF